MLDLEECCEVGPGEMRLRMKLGRRARPSSLEPFAKVVWKTPELGSCMERDRR